MMRTYRNELVLARPPRLVQLLLFAVLAPIGRLLGYKGEYPYPQYAYPHLADTGVDDAASGLRVGGLSSHLRLWRPAGRADFQMLYGKLDDCKSLSALDKPSCPRYSLPNTIINGYDPEE